MLNLTQCKAEKLVKRLFGGERDAEVVLQRLDRLTHDEARTTAAEILKVVYGLFQDMSEEACSPHLLLAAKYYSF